MRKGQKMSQEQKLKLSQTHKGRTFSEEHKRKLSESHKGKIPTNLEQLRQYRKGRPLSAEHKKKIADAQKGKPKNLTDEARKIMSEKKKGQTPWNKGNGDTTRKCVYCQADFRCKKRSTRKYCGIVCKHADHQGEGHYRWIKDRNKIVGRHNRLMHDPDTKIWRRKVFMRDNFCCKMKNSKCGGRIEAHHIHRWHDKPELRYEVSNGITLCHEHHKSLKNKEDEHISHLQSLIG
jgi:hypothetical protein